jgi:hypothetical protein
LESHLYYRGDFLFVTVVIAIAITYGTHYHAAPQDIALRYTNNMTPTCAWLYTSYASVDYGKTQYTVSPAKLNTQFIMNTLDKNSLITILGYTSVDEVDSDFKYNGIVFTSNNSKAINEQNSFTATLINTKFKVKTFVGEEILNGRELSGDIKDFAFYNGNNTTRIVVLVSNSFTYEEFVSKLKTSKQLFIS